MISYKNILRLFWYKLSSKNKNSIQFQQLAESIHEQSLALKNIGQGSFVTQGGEANLFKHITLCESPIVFDVGANRGEYSSLLLKELQPKMIYAFEPVQKVAKFFMEHIKSENVTLITKGVGNKVGRLTIYQDPNNDLLSSLYQRDLSHTKFSLSEKEEIEIVTLDSFCTAHNINQIDFLKLDIEGHEIAALEGAQKLLSEGQIKHIQFEFGGSNLDAKTTLRDFFNLLGTQYALYRILEDGIFEVNYTATQEVYHTTNFLAVLK